MKIRNLTESEKRMYLMGKIGEKKAIHYELSIGFPLKLNSKPLINGKHIR